MAGPEKNLYKMVKDKLAEFNPIRIETTTIKINIKYQCEYAYYTFEMVICLKNIYLKN